MGRHATLLAALLTLVLSGGCAFTLDKRAAEGPDATQLWKFRFARSYDRSPSQDETWRFEDQLEQRAHAYLERHPELTASPRADNLRFWRRVAVGMTKEEVLLLLDRPEATTTDQARMEAAARRFWPEVKKRAKEMWSYPDGWSLFFDGDELADITVHRFQFLQE